MTERKRKRNTRTSKAREGFQISREPVVRLTADDRRNVDRAASLPRAYSPPILFAIARDSHCIFAGWNIDWLTVFEKGMPVDRQVHLRVHRANGLEEKTAAVEPMAGMHYVPTLEPHGCYRLEIGYYRAADAWHSVAMSNEIVMPPDDSSETADVNLVTIPFHLGFQQLVGLLGPANDTELAIAISKFQTRALSSEKRTRLTPKDKTILRGLDVPLRDIATARRAFDRADGEKLAKRSGALIALGASSPSCAFETDWAPAGS